MRILTPEQKEARKRYQKKYQAANKDRVRETQKRWREKNRHIVNWHRAKWKERHPQVTLWSNARYRAKRKGFEFNLDREDIIIPEFCPYLGTRLTFHKMKGHLDSHASVDRIDSSKGYVKGNVEVISYRANVMKNCANREQLIMFANTVLKKFS
jgi:hypothetical protein